MDITFPDGLTIGSDSPAVGERLSTVIGHRVTLEPLRPASDTAFYRRHEAGTALMGRLAQYRPVRRAMNWAVNRGFRRAELMTEFGRQAGEPLPDLAEVPAEAFEFYTPPGTYFDVFPIHLLTRSALAAMSRLNPAARWDVRRFRPNILIGGVDDHAGQVEQSWTGRKIRIGGFTVRGEIPTVRCAMPMHPQADLPRDPSILRTIVREAGQCLGLYATVTEPGSVAAGEAVQLQ